MIDYHYKSIETHQKLEIFQIYSKYTQIKPLKFSFGLVSGLAKKARTRTRTREHKNGLGLAKKFRESAPLIIRYNSSPDLLTGHVNFFQSLRKKVILETFSWLVR